MLRNRSLAVLAGATLALGPALPAAASHDVTPARIAGQTRYGTAAEIALEQYPDGASEAIVASGERYPDALAGAPAAGALDAPVLLTERDEVPDATLSALDELGVEEVTILGGEVAVSEEAEATIAQSLRVQTDRLRGSTRYETAAEIARFVDTQNQGRANYPGGQRAAFVTTGEGFADALAAGPLAASRETPIPVLLTQPDDVPAATAAAIADLDLDLVILVGGTTAVSEDVANQLSDDDTTVERVAGPTRNATATAMADFAREYLGFDSSHVELARGDAFPDALAVAPLAGENRNPILLTDDRTHPSLPTVEWLRGQCEAVEVVRAVGGEAALSTDVLEDVETAAEQCHPTDDVTEQTYTVEPQERLTRAPGEDATFEVVRRYDTGQDVTQPLDVVLFPCDSLQEPADGEFRFADANADGRADGIESTRTGEAVITALNGQDVRDARGYRDVAPEGDQAGIQATVTADAADCAVVVYFDDANNDSALNVDADGLPTEGWGIGVIEWTS